MYLCKKIKIEVSQRDAEVLEFMQAKCRGLYNWVRLVPSKSASYAEGRGVHPEGSVTTAVLMLGAIPNPSSGRRIATPPRRDWTSNT